MPRGRAPSNRAPRAGAMGRWITGRVMMATIENKGVRNRRRTLLVKRFEDRAIFWSLDGKADRRVLL